MSDTPLSPLAGLSADASTDDAREFGAEMARSGGDITTINAELTRRGAPPLNGNSLDIAELARDRLMRDPKFIERYNAGDPSATDQVFAAAARIAQASGKLMDRPAKPDEYNFNAALFSAGGVYDNPGELVNSFAEWSHGLNLPKDVASHIAEEHLSFLGKGANLSKELAEDLGNAQTAILNRALGENAETQIKEASATLTRTLGRDIDLAKVVRGSGANVAMRLVFHAQDLKAKGK